MLTLLTGDNTFAIDQALKQRVASFSGTVEVFDGAELTKGQLADIMTGQTLFSQERFVVIKQPSECKELWAAIAKWLEHVDASTSIVLVEPHIDKRTSAYRWLQKNADVKEYTAWTERNKAKALEWLQAAAARSSLKLSRPHAERILARAGYDQWALYHALEKLSLAGEVSDELIDAVVEASPTENVFALLDTSLSGNRQELAHMLKALRQTEDAYRVFGLLSSQVQQLALLVYSGKSAREVASDIGAKSPFMLQKLQVQAQRLTKAQVKKIVHNFARADMRLKSSDAEPWMIIEALLYSLI